MWNDNNNSALSIIFNSFIIITIIPSVIACRVSPEQKRLVVRLVKKGVHPTPVTLSIGEECFVVMLFL